MARCFGEVEGKCGIDQQRNKAWSAGGGELGSAKYAVVCGGVGGGWLGVGWGGLDLRWWCGWVGVEWRCGGEEVGGWVDWEGSEG